MCIIISFSLDREHLPFLRLPLHLLFSKFSIVAALTQSFHSNYIRICKIVNFKYIINQFISLCGFYITSNNMEISYQRWLSQIWKQGFLVYLKYHPRGTEISVKDIYQPYRRYKRTHLESKLEYYRCCSIWSWMCEQNGTGRTKPYSEGIPRIETLFKTSHNFQEDTHFH